MSGGKASRPQVKVEYVTVDGAEGEALEERQLTVIKEVLAWVHRESANGQEPQARPRDAGASARPARGIRGWRRGGPALAAVPHAVPGGCG